MTSTRFLLMLAGFAAVLLLLPAETAAHGWGSDDMEIFDLVEEVNENFYKMMQINQNATNQEIKRAFRTLSVVLHPDKNDAEDANIKFRNLVSVYEVLKDAGKREKYDKVLKEGLPNWKSALWYYRRVRKVGLAEGAAILLIVATVMQYFISWAAYAEKKYTAEQLFGSKLKKLQKKKQTNVDLDTILSEIPTPSVFNTLPFQIPRGLWRMVTGAPGAVKSAVSFYAEQKKLEEERKLKEKEEEELLRKQEEERARERENRTLRKRNKKFVAPEKTDAELAAYNQSAIQRDDSGTGAATKSKPLVSGGLWTEDDLAELVRLVKKYPGGTTDRWEVIAELMGRSVTEVTYMAHKMKDGGYKVGQGTESVAESIMQEAAKQKVKTKKEPVSVAAAEVDGNANWSQVQQAAFEQAIQKYPKSGASDRWQKIAGSVPGKSREECMARYKYLVELVKKQREEKERETKAEVECPATVEGQESPAPVVEEQSSKGGKGKGKKKGKKEVDENGAEENHDEADKENCTTESADKPAAAGGGKAKNKRRERKKQIEFYSYEDSDGDDGEEDA
uniref:Putative dnaj molecular chaperone similarity domain protein n=1 Tax=Culex tarsalis TaxID=7177 RepID=A0A1Q3FDL0_CULTA